MRSVRRLRTLWPLVIICGCGIQLDSLLLVPSPNFRVSPSDLNYVYEEAAVSCSDGTTVNAWRIRTSGTPKGIVVVVPGADGNKGRYSLVLPIFVDKGWDVLLFDYPGFGNSPGTATLAGLLESTRAMLDYAFQQHNVIVGYGVSLGADVLTRVAADYQLGACIFDSLGDMRSIGSDLMNYRGLPAPLGDLADFVIAASTSEDFDMKRWIVEVKSPKLFLHSPDDTLIPWQEALDIFALAPQPKHLVTTQGDHAQQLFVDPEMYRSVINGWLEGVFKLDPIQHPQYRQLLDNELQAIYQDFGITPGA
jgi:uncharacterized protein